jgi:hypothetical protein
MVVYPIAYRLAACLSDKLKNQLEVDDNSFKFDSKQSARNGLGLAWRYAHNDLDRSDRFFPLHYSGLGAIVRVFIAK